MPCRALKYLKSLTSLSLLAACTLYGASASAQQAGFYLDRAQLSGAPDDPFMTWRPYMSNDSRFYASAALGYSLNPLRLDTLVPGERTDRQAVLDQYGNPFSNQAIAYLGGGLQVSKRVGFDLMLPIALVNVGGKDPQAGDIGGSFADGAAIHDTRASIRFMGYESDDKRFRWGGGGSLFFTTGNVVRYASDDETTSWLYTNFEYHAGDMMFLAMVGPHFRPLRGPTKSNLEIGNEVRMSFGAFMPFYDAHTTLGLEIWGQTGFHDVTVRDQDNVPYGDPEFAMARIENNSLEWLLQARRDMGPAKKPKSWYIQAGGGTLLLPGYGAASVRLLAQIGSHILFSALEPEIKYKPKRSGDHTPLDGESDIDGDGFPDSIDQCPQVKEDGKPPFTDDGCPDLDKDDDGILDKVDKCPTVKEDKDGIEDEDGCPEDDADKDGILDVDDACPLVKGVKSDNPKKNGCPAQHKRILVTSDAVELLEPVQFAYNEARILPESFDLLDEVYDLMRTRPGMKLGIHGHTDNRGGAAYNKTLSARRAASVMKYLVEKGIANELLESKGFGMEKPITGNDTEAGRAKNRRVEFKILKQ